MKLTQKMVSFLLAMVMVFSILPISILAADSETNCSVVINFEFENGEVAAQSYSGSFAKGTGYGTTVSVPHVVGYTPTAPIGYDTEVVEVVFTSSQLTYNFTNIQHDITLNVVYVPAEVNYTVNYYQQNVDDDYYTLVRTDTKTGLTKAVVAETYENLKNKYSGFYGLHFETPTIAADGSTVVEIFYDRDYFMMDFMLGDGGYGVDPIFDRYGAPIDTLATPTRPGYTFTGWDQSIPDTMPDENKVYTALWSPATVSYTVVFWYENADDDGYSYMAHTNGTAIAGSTVVSSSFQNTNFTGRDSTHFTYNADMAESKTVAGDGSTILNVYFKRNLYSLTFVAPVYSCGMPEHTAHTSSCYDDSLICGKEEHTEHSSSCYTGVSTKYTGIFTFTWQHNNGNGSLHSISGTYYIYLDGSWYKYTGNRQNNNSVATPTCGKEIHTHSDTCRELICTMEIHTHSKTCGGSNGTVKIITAKYDADLAEYWPIIGNDGNVYTRQMWQSSVTGDKYVFLQKMPDNNITMTAFSRTGTTVYWYYYLEVIPGQSTDGLITRTEGGRTYYLYLSSSAITTALTYAEDYFPITGFTQRDSSVPRFSNNTAYLYYTRNFHSLSYNDNYGTTTTAPDQIYFDDVLGQSRNITPDYPSSLEAGAYEFGGWYTTPQCFDGTEVNFDTFKMPDLDLMIYAKWTPITHEIMFHVTFNDEDIIADETVAHGSTAATPEEPQNGRYEFVGWFYMDNDVERAYSPNLRITKDIDVYAKWRSNVLIDYRIQYQLVDGTPIADDTTGSALAGIAKTFDAKGGNALYDGYKEGFFPSYKSHAVEMDIDAEGEIVYTFVYEEIEAVPYTVKYLNKADNSVVAAEDIHNDNRKAVVTEYAKIVPGYLPESFQQRLIITAEGENVLIFYYNADAQHAIVSKTHYTVTGTSEIEYRHSEETGTIGSSYTGTQISIDNYVLDHITINDETVANDADLERELTADGLHYKFYYREVDVTINYTAEEGGSVVGATETVAVFSGNPTGSKAIPDNGYRVSGWFTAGGTAANGIVTINSDGSYNFVPAKANGKNVAATYTARFVRNEVTDKIVVVDFGMSVNFSLDGQAVFKGISKTAPDQAGILTENLFSDTSLESNYGTLVLSNNKLVYTPTAMLDGEDTFYYSAQIEQGYYRYASVTVIPATSVYYEEKFVEFSDGWETAGSEKNNISQTLDLAGDKSNIYGYDPANGNSSTYSLGSAKKVTVIRGITVWSEATFTFTGTGFDIISVTSKNTGTIAVDVYEGTGTNGKLAAS
ncbi:MAG: InlB B-repeat-containing protein [Clostridia bacterium]|nr:InlB B-repeat-containing protein [Clostridia bacterium]